MSLPAVPPLPILVHLEIRHKPRGLLGGAFTGMSYDTIFECGNLKIVHFYSSGRGALYLVTHDTVNLNDSRMNPAYLYV